MRRRRVPARLRLAISVGGSFRPARTVVRGGRRQAREAALRIGEIAAVRTCFARTSHHEVANLTHAFGNAAHEVLRRCLRSRPRISSRRYHVSPARRAVRCTRERQSASIPSRQYRSSHAGERAFLALLLALALLVAQHLRTAAHRPRRARFHVAGIALERELLPARPPCAGSSRVSPKCLSAAAAWAWSYSTTTLASGPQRLSENTRDPSLPLHS